MKFVNIKLKSLYFIMKIMRISYLLLIESNEIIYLINLISDMSETTDNVNVTEILSFKKNKCVFNEL